MLRFNRLHVALLTFILIALVYYVGVRNGFTHHDEYESDSDDDYQSIDTKMESFLNDRDDHLIWFIHISDLHISIFHNQDIVKDLDYFIKNILAIVKPKVVIATGDLTDAKFDNMRSTTQFEQEWKIYSQLLKDNRVLEKTVWLDLRGNHDNFDVFGKDSEKNLFKKYGVMRKKEHIYIYKFNMTNGDQYSFIGLDACTDPGPKAPFNFFGHLNSKDIEIIKKYDESSKSSNATIWFGHFPTSIIYSPTNLRDAMSNGAAYLCGHLHTAGDLVPSMYARQSNGMLELELSDWKFNRKFRILAFDAGLLSFQDFKLSMKNKSTHNILILITNPKNVLFKTTQNREPLKRSRHSSHIRFLVFSQQPLVSAHVFIDNVDLGEAVAFNSSSSPLYTLKWNPFEYRKGIHRLRVIVKDIEGFVQTASHEFALDDTIRPFSGLANFILTNDQATYMSVFFWTGFLGNLVILIFFRFVRRRFTVHFISCNPFRTLALRYLRRFSLLSSIDYIYWSLIGLLIYVPFGPWFIAEIFSNQYGVVFRWGILVEDYYIPQDIQNFAAFLHMISFQFLLMFHLSYQIEYRFVHLDFNQTSSNNRLANSRTCNETISVSWCDAPIRLVKWILVTMVRNISFILLWASAIWYLKDLYLCYSFIAVLICPFKLWMPLIAVYLRHKCANLTVADFDRFIDTSKLRTTVNRNVEQLLLDDQLETKQLLSSSSSSAFKES